jgi:hypothetical protein
LAADAKTVGWIMSGIESALFYLYDGACLVGIMASHVDDLITCGQGPVHETAMKKLADLIFLKEKKGSFRFCGKNIVQNDDFTVTVEQVDAIEALDYQVVDKAKRKNINAPLSESEKTDFRALIGSLWWVARQTRPDIMVNVSMASQSLGSPKVKDVVELNKAVKMLKESPEAPWRYVPSELTLDNCVVFVCSDSSFANIEGGKSQCGYVVAQDLRWRANTSCAVGNHIKFDQASLQEHIGCRIQRISYGCGGCRLRISLAARDDELQRQPQRLGGPVSEETYHRIHRCEELGSNDRERSRSTSRQKSQAPCGANQGVSGRELPGCLGGHISDAFGCAYEDWL